MGILEVTWTDEDERDYLRPKMPSPEQHARFMANLKCNGLTVRQAFELLNLKQNIAEKE